MCVCMFVCSMYVCMFVCSMCVCVYVCIKNVEILIIGGGGAYPFSKKMRKIPYCMYIRMYACMYVCMLCTGIY